MTQPLMSLMQDDFPLNLHHVRRRMRSAHPGAEVVTLTDHGTVRASYGEISGRIDRLARVLGSLGVKQGDRVGTFAWNNQRHFELYMAIPCVGAVLHTLNVRLYAEQLTYIVNHAEDEVIFVDDSLVGILEKLAPTFHGVRHYVVMGDPARPDPAHPGDSNPARPSLPNALRYEELLGGRRGGGHTTTPRSMSVVPRRSATRAARPATRRVCSTPTARSACTPPRH